MEKSKRFLIIIPHCKIKDILSHRLPNAPAQDKKMGIDKKKEKIENDDYIEKKRGVGCYCTQ